jgi:L-lactate utilization protein LutB
MYKIHGFCFDPCTVEMEADLRKAGLYQAYEKKMMQGNIKAFASDIEQWVDDYINAEMSFVTEQGDVEDWKSNDNIKKRVLENLKMYLGHLKEHM